MIDVTQCLPAAGQGAVGIECRQEAEIELLLAPLADPETTACVLAERAMNRHLQGGCQVPIAGYAIIEEGQLFLRALVGEVDGSSILRAEGRSAVADAETLGIQVAEKLLQQGADKILQTLYSN